MARRLLIISALVAVVVVGAWIVAVQRPSSDSSTHCYATLSPQTSVTSVYVQPDDGYSPVLDEINQAHCSIDLSMYLLSDRVVIEALINAANRGIVVRVILERSPFNSYGGQEDVVAELTTAGMEVQWASDRFQFSHAKYMIVDRQSAILGNQNFTGAGFNSNREFGVVTTEPSVVMQAAAVFDADWKGSITIEGLSTLVVSPVNARARILELINSADTSIWMYAEVLRDERFTQALDRAAARGVDVRLIVNPSIDDDNVPYYLDAMAHGVQVRVLNRPYVHAKLIIVDGERALIGSQNYSSTSLDQNREVGLIVSDPDALSRLVDVFTRDWQKSAPVDSISTVFPRLTERAVFGSISSGRWGVV
ncbi:MAG: phospholipase D-like domain-containing protein [Thermomicrobiales bacterium]|nr:phospholipase D-like domain-containing protein [Thermomicrobiales bacterium]